MKLYKSVFFLLMLSWLNAQEIKIKGEVIESPDPEIVLNLPVNGKYFNGNNKMFSLDKDEKYEIVALLEEPGFVSITNDFKTAVIYAEPNETYEVDFNNTEIIFKGETAKKQNLLNDLGLYAEARSFVDPKEHENLAEKEAFYEGWYKTRLEKLNAALQNELITNKEYDLFLNLLKIKVADFKSADYYFTYRLQYEIDDEKKDRFNVDYLEAWQKVYQEVFQNPAYEKYLSLTEFIDRLKGFNQIKETGRLSFSNQKIPYKIDYINYFKEKLPDNFIEYQWGNRIYDGILDNKFEKEWIDNFNDFKIAYPSSKLIPLLSPYIDKVIEFHSNINEVEYVKGYENINTLEELFQQFKGQVVYVDFWATWCGPCRQEMQYSKKNHEKLEEMGVLPLYLSVDLDRDDATWKGMVEKLSLGGVHMRSNKKLKAEIETKLKYGIPYYLIIGKDGEVKVWGAKRPSDQIALFEQLQEYI